MTKTDQKHLITQFGCEEYTSEITQKLEEVTNEKPHLFFRRNLIYAHRGFVKMLEDYKQTKEVYIYTGRGPSSGSMHIGHALPFKLCVYLQKVFRCHVVIQLTDNEKFFYKKHITSIEESRQYAYENAKDIIAFGFEPSLTHIFINSLSFDLLSKNYLRIAKITKLSEVLPSFGYDSMSCSVGCGAFPVFEIAPAYSSTFPTFLKPLTPCLVPASIDQDPFFRTARDKAGMLGEIKPTTLYIKQLPDLKGIDVKMSSSGGLSNSGGLDSTPIFLNITKEELSKKIKTQAFSGGRISLAEHREKGGDTDIDVSFQYLKFFMENDEDLKVIEEKFKKGTMTSSELKGKCIDVLWDFIEDFQIKRAKITDKDLNEFLIN